MTVELVIPKVRQLLNAELVPRLLHSIVHLADDQVGWYRRLDRSDTVGIAATAQALLVLSRTTPLERDEEQRVLGTLVSKQRNDGAWPFISTLPDVGVVDSTAIVVCALAAHPDRKVVGAAVTRAAKWLDDVALPNGGWGVVGGAPFRVYSTCLALRALSAVGQADSKTYKLGMKALIAACDTTAFGWRSSNQSLSIGVSALALYTICVEKAAEGHKQLIAKVVASIKQQLDEDERSPSLDCGTWELEEVEITVGTIRRRIEYKHYSLALVARALLNLEERGSPELIRCMVRLLAGYERRVIETSWELHDVSMAAADLLARLDPSIESLWLKDRHVLTHKVGEGRLVRFLRRHYSESIWSVCGLIVIAVLLQKGDIRGAFSAKEVLFLLGTVAVSVFANYLTPKLIRI